jgi:hypothetical protein
LGFTDRWNAGEARRLERLADIRAVACTAFQPVFVRTDGDQVGDAQLKRRLTMGYQGPV